MSRKEIIESIDNLTKKTTEFKREVNESLNNIRGSLGSVDDTDDYERGLNDAWKAAAKVALSPSNGGYSCNVLLEILGTGSLYDIFNEFTAKEVIEKLKVYEEQMDNDAFRVGDVVEFTDMDLGVTKTGIYYGESPTIYSVLVPGRRSSLDLYKSQYNMRKTGTHVELFKDLEERSK